MSDLPEKTIGVSHCGNCIFAQEMSLWRVVCTASMIGYGGSGVFFIEAFVAGEDMPDKCPLRTHTIKVVKNA